jgi:hypothetical protein
LSLVLKYPPFDTKIETRNQQPFIFDFVRKKWLVLTPEEWVRQHLLNYFIHHKNYRASFISIEKELVLNDLKRRYDVVVYDKTLKPFIIVECKAPFIELSNEVVAQAQRYNLTIQSPYLMISNGVNDLVLNVRNEICELPAYL